jgi:hypothetical protein
VPSLEIFDELDAARDELATVMRARAFDADRYAKALEKVRTLEADIFRSGPRRRGRAKGKTSASAPGFEKAGTESAPITDAFTREMRDAIRAAERWRAIVDATDTGIAKGIIETNEAIGDSFEDLPEPIIDATNEMSTFAEQAARNMQDSFADFLFDPFEDGVRGMLKGFVDVLRRMIAEAAAAQIFETLFGKSKDGTNGFVDSLGTFLGSIFGAGTNSVPKYAAGIDYVPRTQLALVHKGERIIPAGMNRSGSSPTVNINTHIDARGATPDAIKALPEILRKNNEALEARIISRLRSGRYA